MSGSTLAASLRGQDWILFEHDDLTDDNDWPDFCGLGQNPIGFVGLNLNQDILDRAFEGADIEIRLKNFREETEDIKSRR